MDKLVIKGARENNLKNISLELPKNKLIVMTGLSGCGKSSLAFDTIYQEGQRRFVESLSSYARQFIGGLEKPDVDSALAAFHSDLKKKGISIKSHKSTSFLKSSSNYILKSRKCPLEKSLSKW